MKKPTFFPSLSPKRHFLKEAPCWHEPVPALHVLRDGTTPWLCWAKSFPVNHLWGDNSTDPSPGKAGSPLQEMLLCPAQSPQWAQIHHISLLGHAGTQGTTDSPHPAHWMVIVTLIVHVRHIWAQKIGLVTGFAVGQFSLSQTPLSVTQCKED